MYIEDLLIQLSNKTIDSELLPQIGDLISVLIGERDDAIQKRRIDLLRQQRQVETMRRIAGIDENIGPCEIVERLLER